MTTTGGKAPALLHGGLVMLAVALLAVMAGAWDASDGEVRVRGHVESREIDPKGFRGALIARYGIMTLMGGVFGVAMTAAGLVQRRQQQA